MTGQPLSPFDIFRQTTGGGRPPIAPTGSPLRTFQDATSDEALQRDLEQYMRIIGGVVGAAAKPLQPLDLNAMGAMQQDAFAPLANIDPNQALQSDLLIGSGMRAEISLGKDLDGQPTSQIIARAKALGIPNPETVPLEQLKTYIVERRSDLRPEQTGMGTGLMASIAQVGLGAMKSSTELAAQWLSAVPFGKEIVDNVFKHEQALANLAQLDEGVRANISEDDQKAATLYAAAGSVLPYAGVGNAIFKGLSVGLAKGLSIPAGRVFVGSPIARGIIAGMATNASFDIGSERPWLPSAEALSQLGMEPEESESWRTDRLEGLMGVTFGNRVMNAALGGLMGGLAAHWANTTPKEVARSTEKGLMTRVQERAQGNVDDIGEAEWRYADDADDITPVKSTPASNGDAREMGALRLLTAGDEVTSSSVSGVPDAPIAPPSRPLLQGPVNPTVQPQLDELTAEYNSLQASFNRTRSPAKRAQLTAEISNVSQAITQLSKMAGQRVTRTAEDIAPEIVPLRVEMAMIEDEINVAARKFAQPLGNNGMTVGPVPANIPELQPLMEKYDAINERVMEIARTAGLTKETLPGVWDSIQNNPLRPVTPAAQLARAYGTVLVNSDGSPRVWFHGTGQGYANPDPTKLDPQALWGPGFYGTANPVIAGGDPTSVYDQEGGYAGGSAGRFYDARRNLQTKIDHLSSQMALFEAEGPNSGIAPETYAEYQSILPGLQQQFDATPMPAPNVRPFFLLSSKPFQAQKEMTREEGLDLIRQISQLPRARAPEGEENQDLFWSDVAHDWTVLTSRAPSGTVIAERLADLIAHKSPDIMNGAEPFGMLEFNRSLVELGYDAITHGGGLRTGNDPHDVAIALDMSKILPVYLDEASVAQAAAALGVDMFKQNAVLNSPSIEQFAGAPTLTDGIVASVLHNDNPGGVFVLKGISDPQELIETLAKNVYQGSVQGASQAMRPVMRGDRLDALVSTGGQITDQMIDDYGKYGVFVGMEVMRPTGKLATVTAVYDDNVVTQTPAQAARSSKALNRHPHGTLQPTNKAPDIFVAPELYAEFKDFALGEVQAVISSVNLDDIVSPLRTGDGTVGVGFDPSLIKKLGVNLYSGELGKVAVKEGIQNAVDSVRPMIMNGEAGKVTAVIDVRTNSVHLIDNGIGMPPEVVEKEFMDVGGSYKDSSSGMSGGYGLAKVGLFSQADHIDVSTVAKVGDVYLETILSGSGEDWAAGKMVLNTQEAEDAETGTRVSIRFPVEIQVEEGADILSDIISHNQTGAEIEGFMHYDSPGPGSPQPSTWEVRVEDEEGGIQVKHFSEKEEALEYIEILNETPGGFPHTLVQHKAPPTEKRTWEVKILQQKNPNRWFSKKGFTTEEDAMSWIAHKDANADVAGAYEIIVKQSKASGGEAGVKIVAEPVHVEDPYHAPVPGARMTIAPSTRVRESGYIEAIILNNGLYQFNKQLYIGNNANVPEFIVVNVVPTVGVDDGDYPFTTSREALKGDAANELEEFVRNIRQEAQKRETRILVESVLKAPTIGASTARVISTDGNVPYSLAVEIAQADYTEWLNTAFSNILNRTFEATQREYQGMAKPAAAGIGLGNSYLGLNINGVALRNHAVGQGMDVDTMADQNMILFNPYVSFQEVSRKFGPVEELDYFEKNMLADALAHSTIGTAVHEMAHQLARGHNEDFSGVLTRIISPNSMHFAESFQEIRAVWDKILTSDAVNRFSKDLDSLISTWSNKNVFKSFSAHSRPEGDLEGGVVDSDTPISSLQSTTPGGQGGNGERIGLGTAGVRGESGISETAGSDSPIVRAANVGSAGIGTGRGPTVVDWWSPIVFERLPDLLNKFLDAKGITDPAARAALARHFDLQRIEDAKSKLRTDPDGEKILNFAEEAESALSGSQRADEKPNIFEQARMRGFTLLPNENRPGYMVADNQSTEKWMFTDEEAVMKFLQETPLDRLPDITPAIPEPMEAVPPLMGDQNSNAMPNEDELEDALHEDALDDMAAEPLGGGGAGAPPPTPPVSGLPAPMPDPGRAPVFKARVPSRKEMLRAEMNKKEVWEVVHTWTEHTFRRYLMPFRNDIQDLDEALFRAGATQVKFWPMFDDVDSGINKAHTETAPFQERISNAMRLVDRESLRNGTWWRSYEILNPVDRALNAVQAGFRQQEIRAMAEVDRTLIELTGDPKAPQYLKQFIAKTRSEHARNNFGDPAYKHNGLESIDFFAHHAASTRSRFENVDARTILRQFVRAYGFDKYARASWDLMHKTASSLRNMEFNGERKLAHAMDVIIDKLDFVQFGPPAGKDTMVKGVNRVFNAIGIPLTHAEARGVTMGVQQANYMAMLGLDISVMARDALQPLLAIPTVGLDNMGDAYTRALGGFGRAEQEAMLARSIKFGVHSPEIPRTEKPTTFEAVSIGETHKFTPVQEAKREVAAGLGDIVRNAGASMERLMERWAPSARKFDTKIFHPLGLYNKQGKWHRIIVGEGAYWKFVNAYTEFSGLMKGAVDSGNMALLPNMKNFARMINADTFRPAVTRSIMEKLSDNRVDDAISEYMRAVVNSTQGSFGALHLPAKINTTGARMAFGFGNFSSNAQQFLYEKMRFGSSTHKLKMAALIAGQAAMLYKLEEETGFLFKKWMWVKGYIFTGSPILTEWIDAFRLGQEGVRALTQTNVPAKLEQSLAEGLGPVGVGVGIVEKFNPVQGGFDTYQNVNRSLSSPNPVRAVARTLFTGDNRGGAADWGDVLTPIFLNSDTVVPEGNAQSNRMMVPVTRQPGVNQFKGPEQQVQQQFQNDPASWAEQMNLLPMVQDTMGGGKGAQ